MRKFLKFNKINIKKTTKKNLKGGRVEWNKASDIEKRIKRISSDLGLKNIKNSRVFCFRSYNSRSKAYARIWGLSRVWQKALNTEAAYVVEVLSERFDRLPKKEQDRVLIHELAHIPNNFSGSLLPHIRKRGKRNFNDRVRQLIYKYSSNK